MSDLKCTFKGPYLSRVYGSVGLNPVEVEWTLPAQPGWNCLVGTELLDMYNDDEAVVQWGSGYRVYASHINLDGDDSRRLEPATSSRSRDDLSRLTQLCTLLVGPPVTHLGSGGFTTFTVRDREVQSWKLPKGQQQLFGLFSVVVHTLLGRKGSTPEWGEPTSELDCDGTPVQFCPLLNVGLVLVNQVELHLSWPQQQRVGRLLRALFPRVQWVVSTQSPLICQGAADGHGSIYVLPNDAYEEARQLDGTALNRILYGNILDATGTEVFGSVERSPQGEALLERLARLSLDERSRRLTAEEEAEQDRLRSIFATDRTTKRTK